MEDEPAVADSAGHTMIDIDALYTADDDAAEAAAEDRRKRDEAA